MYRIIMADNQQQSVDIVNRVVDYAKKKIELTHVVQSGAEIIQLAQEEKPHIILISVELLGINGIEAARRIRMFDKTVHIILFSEYDYFEFVKEAISNNVDDYILKPIHYETLLERMEIVIAAIDEEKEQEQNANNCYTQLGTIREYLDYSFIYSILFNGQNDAELKRYKEVLRLMDCGYIINIEINSILDDNNNIEATTIYQCIKEIVTKYHICAVGPKVLNRILVYVSSDTCNIEAPEEHEYAQMIGKELVEWLQVTLNLEVSIGIGSIRKLDTIHISYEEALRCLRYRGKSTIVHVGDIKKKNIELKSYLELEAKILDSIKFGKEETLTYFSGILELLRPLKIEAKKNKIIELLALLCHEARVELQSETEYVDYIQNIEAIRNMSWEKMESWAYQRVELINKIIRINRNGKKSNSIKEAIQYMEEHYQEEISLDDLSRYIGISPQHLSKLFKDETGVNYVDWLTKLRIDMAKHLILAGGQTIKEICYLVGYNDPNYFSRLFKKMVGISPTDYANSDKANADKISNKD